MNRLIYRGMNLAVVVREWFEQRGDRNMDGSMSRITHGLVVGATVLGGILAGGNVERAIVHMPAWRHVGAPAWAAFSREADLGNGLIVYPLEAIGGAVLSIAAAITYHFDRSAPRTAAFPIYAAATMVAGGMLATTQAAPIMLSLRQPSNDSITLQRAFDGFEFWGGVRGVFQILAFGANLWSLVALLRPSTHPVLGWIAHGR